MKKLLRAGWLVMAAALVLGMTACSSEESAIEEKPTAQQPAQTATTIHVTVGAGMSDGESSPDGQGTAGDGATRSAVDVTTDEATHSKTRTLKFTTGDRLYVYRTVGGGEHLAGMLSMKAGTLAANGLSATFEGDLTLYGTQATMPSGDPLTGSTAQLVHKGMTEGTHYSIAADTRLLTFDDATKVAADVATLMTTGLKVEGSYTAGTGYELRAAMPILNCCIGGLVAETAYTFTLSGGSYSTTVGWTTDAQGTASFAFASPASGSQSWTLSVSQGQTAVGTINLGQPLLNLGAKVYNVNRYLFGGAFTKEIDLADVGSNLPVGSELTVTNGLTLKGELWGNYKISIAPGATVTLSNARIPGRNATDNDTQWAGITCLGDATIVLAEGTENYVRGYHCDFPGIKAGPAGTTLTIRGTGTLEAETGMGVNDGFAAGIGGGQNQTVGNIRIEGGTITARGNMDGAGIGSGNAFRSIASCGDITITGGNITATGGKYAAGIGSGCNIVGSNSCGNITIGGWATGTATGGEYSPNDIGAGYNGTCGTVSVAANTISGVYPGTAECTFIVRFFDGNSEASVMASKIIVRYDDRDYEFTSGVQGVVTYLGNYGLAMGELPRGRNMTLTFTAETVAEANPHPSTGTFTATATFTITGSSCDLGEVNLVKQQ